MEFIFPNNARRIRLTKNFEGDKIELALQLAHTKPKTEVDWYDTFLQKKQNFHEIGNLPYEENIK